MRMPLTALRPHRAIPLPSTGVPQSAHLIGICGSGMRSLAELLHESRCRVTGSDLLVSDELAAAFARRGMRIDAGHRPAFVPADAELVVYSQAVPVENRERQYAMQQGIPQLSYSEMLGRLMHDRIGVCIAGTHGKSTTAAMTGWIMTAAKLDPSVIVGAELVERQAGGRYGSGEHLVVESCEYQRSFLDLAPTHAAILSIEPDHFDCYAHFDEAVAAFAEFAQKAPANGSLLIPAAGEAVRAACLAASAPVETFGLSSDADWWASDVRSTSTGARFRVFHRGAYFAEVSLRLTGRHNVENALAAAALAHHCGAGPHVIREALAEFPGLRRRFESRGTWRGAALFDDYAHHPTAVSATLTAARERFPKRRIWCVFQPHQVSRTKALFDGFAESLLGADEVLTAPVYAAREIVSDEPWRMSLELAARVCELGGRARYVAGLDRALATLDDELSPGDVLLTMGAGDIGQIHHEFTRRLRRHSAT